MGKKASSMFVCETGTCLVKLQNKKHDHEIDHQATEIVQQYTSATMHCDLKH